MSTTSGFRDYGRFDELAEEFARRYRRGERPSLQEYVDRLPEMADEIREMFPALIEVERADGDVRDEARQPATPAIPRLRELGDYRILREIGRGGMGVVYEAEQISLGRRVALKVLPALAVGDRTAMERFRREAKAAARMHHTNIVPVFEVGREGEFAFYAMQLIQGQGLDQVIEELKRLPASARSPDGRDPESPGPNLNSTVAQVARSVTAERDLARIAQSLLSGRMVTEVLNLPTTASPPTAGLDATEAFEPVAPPGLATEDGGGVRPPGGGLRAAEASTSAVLPGGKQISAVDTSGRRQPYFRSVAQIGRQAAQGLAYAHSRGVVHRDIKPSNLMLDSDGVVWITDFGLAKAEDDGLTATGDILGTLRYMAPERFRGAGDARADIYALGLTLYELLTLHPAYDSSDRLRLIEQIKGQEPAGPRTLDSRIPRDLETIVLKAMDKNPEKRYSTADALAEDLRRFLADEPIRGRRVGATERYWRWARRHPGVAVLGGLLALVLVMVTAGSLLVAGRMANLAGKERFAATSERQARQEAAERAKAEASARGEADEARAAAQGETYAAMLSEVKALRAGHQVGWREEALGKLARLGVMPTPRRDVVELRSEAVASLGEFAVKEVARFEVAGWTCSRLDFSPDSGTLVTASNNGHLGFWDVAGRKHVASLAGQALEAYRGQVLFLPDGELAFLSARGGVAFLSKSGQRSTWEPIERYAARAVRLGIDRQGRSLVIGWDDGLVDLIDLGTHRRQQVVGPWQPVELAGNHEDQTMRPVAAEGDHPSITAGPCSGNALGLIFSPDGTTVAGVMGRWLVLWDIASKRELMRLGGHKEAITALAFSPDGEMVATTCGDSMTRIWDARDGRALAVVPGPWFMRSLAFSPDGAYLAASADPGPVCLYQLKGRGEQRRLVGHSAGSLSVAFHPRLPRLASSSDDRTIMIWDAVKARRLSRLDAHARQVTGLAYSPDGSMLASTCGGLFPQEDVADNTIRLWDTETGMLREELPRATYSGAWWMAFDRTGNRLVCGDGGGKVVLWDVGTKELLLTEQLGGPITGIEFRDGDRQLLAGTESGEVVLLALDPSGSTRRIHLPDGCKRLVVDQSTERAIVGDRTGTLLALSLPDLTVVGRLAGGHEGDVVALAVSPDGRLLVTSGLDRRVVLRDATTFEALLTLPAWTGVVRNCAFDPTGRWLALSGTDSDVALWDLGLVRDELAMLGLAWEQPAPAIASAESLADLIEPTPTRIPLIPSVSIDPAALQEARDLVTSGIAAFQEARFADAVLALRQASEHLETLRQFHPSDPTLASLHGISLGYEAGSLRGLKRPAEALGRARESLEVYESMIAPNPTDLYNMACCCARISALDDRGASEERENLEARAVGYIKQAIDRDHDGIMPMISGDHDLDPLRARTDFRAMIADAAFPRDPFQKPSPLDLDSLSPVAQLELSTFSEAIGRHPTDFRSWRARGNFLARQGAWERALLDYRKVVELHPPGTWVAESGDTILAMEAAVVFLQAGDVDSYRQLARKMLDRLAATKDPAAAERTAKVALLLQPPEADLRRAAELAEQSVRLGEGSSFLPWFQLVRGISAYRSDELTEAVEWLEEAATRGLGPEFTSARQAYLAMALFRLGEPAQARAHLLEASETIAAGMALQDRGASWHDLGIAELARREAKALIFPEPSEAAEPAGP